MADDGTGESVNIPSFLVSRSDGEKLAEAIHKENTSSNKRSNMVIAQAYIDLASKTKGAVDVDLWYTSIYEIF